MAALPSWAQDAGDLDHLEREAGGVQSELGPKEGMEGCAMEVVCLKVQGHQGSRSGREGGAARET